MVGHLCGEGSQRLGGTRGRDSQHGGRQSGAAQYQRRGARDRGGVLALDEDTPSAPEPAESVLQDGLPEVLAALARHGVVDREQDWPVTRRARDVLLEGPDAAARERLLDAAEGPIRGRAPLQGREQTVHHAERVLVEPEPDMESVLLDALAALVVASAGTLAAQAPSHLVDGDVVLVAPARPGLGEPVHR